MGKAVANNKYFVQQQFVDKKAVAFNIQTGNQEVITLTENMSDDQILNAINKGVSISHFGETERGIKTPLSKVQARQEKTRLVRSGIRRKKTTFVQKQGAVKSNAKEKALAEENAKLRFMFKVTKSDYKAAEKIFNKSANEFTEADVKLIQKALKTDEGDLQKLYDAIRK